MTTQQADRLIDEPFHPLGTNKAKLERDLLLRSLEAYHALGGLLDSVELNLDDLECDTKYMIDLAETARKAIEVQAVLYAEENNVSIQQNIRTKNWEADNVDGAYMSKGEAAVFAVQVLLNQ